MLCDICKKNKAVVHYTEVINDKIKKLNLCEECAISKGISVQPPFSIGELLSGLTPSAIDPSLLEKQMTCPGCGMSFSDFKEGGRLGCAQCYDAFSKALIPLIGSIHKSTRHIGKIPSTAKEAIGVASKIRELELKLQEAVKKEEFELAAKLRDEIKMLEKKGKDKNKG